MNILQAMGQEAKKASKTLSTLSTEQKNQVLRDIIKNLQTHESTLLKINAEEVKAAQKMGLSDAMVDRLSLQGRIAPLLQDIQTVIDLPDPIGEIIEEKILPNALRLAKWRVPLGTLGIIYESRPNVTLDVSALALKSGNSAILRGGSETIKTNQYLVEIIQSALEKNHLPIHAIQLIQTTERSLVKDLLRMHEFIDLIIPRGAAQLHQFCRENSTVPVMTGGIGICHLYVDKTADLAKSLPVIVNAKTQRPTVCNALDTLLVDTSVASTFLPKMYAILYEKGVKFKLDEKAFAILKGQPDCFRAQEEEDWDTEWLSLVLGVKVVEGLNEAIAHIQTHSSGHSDGILSEDPANIEHFLHEIDSAAVYVNASTRFTDGSQFGLGAEVAISTQKLHARGPLGLKELTSYKWVIYGDYQVRK